MTALAESTDRRWQPRYRGEPAVHQVRFEPQADGTELALCGYCGVITRLEGGRYSDEKKARLIRQHEGTEDP